MPKANFRVEPRLASLLGENYRSTEQAIRELVDNSWDADAENVTITLPAIITDDPIIVADDGCGMTKEGLQRHYLAIAHDRRSRGGEKTPLKGRPIRGRKGIGKFAGLVAAEVMQVETKAQGTCSVFEIQKSMLLASEKDLENIDLPLTVSACEPDEHGTRIVLSRLNARLSLPTQDALKELLSLGFGRYAGFAIKVNGELLTHGNIPGPSTTASMELPGSGTISLRFTIMDGSKGARHAGIVTRVGGKNVGKPSFFGLDGDEEIPRKLLNRVVGEIEADGLEGDITADWGTFFENSTAYRELQEWARVQVKAALESTFTNEMNLGKARSQKRIRAVSY